MPPKRKGKKRASAKGASKRKSVKKAKTSKAKAQKSKKSNRCAEGKRGASAYILFCKDRRSDVLPRTAGLNVAEQFAASQKALAEAWRSLGDGERQQYEACALLDKCRSALDRLRKEVRSEKHATKVAAAVKDAVVALGHVAGAARLNGIAANTMDALERLDEYAIPAVRVALGEHLGPAVVSPACATSLRRALGEPLGDRLVALLHRWHGSGTRKRETSGATPAKPAGSAQTPKLDDPKAEGPIDDAIRKKVVGMLMRCFANGANKAPIVLRSREIENALFERHGSNAKDYKRQARSISFNLGATDGALMNRVLDGQLAPKELVHMSAEDLASDELKVQREEARERHFRSEVYLTQGPPKRRRDLYGRSKMAEGTEAEPPQDEWIGHSRADDEQQFQGEDQQGHEEPWGPVGTAVPWLFRGDVLSDAEKSRDKPEGSSTTGSDSEGSESESSESGSSDS